MGESMQGSNRVDGSQPDAGATMKVRPLRSTVRRAKPDPWIHRGKHADDFFARQNVSETYDEAPATIAHYAELYVDGASQICVDASGELVFANIADAQIPRVARQVEHIRAALKSEDVHSIASDRPLAILSTPRCFNYYHFLFDDISRIALYEHLEDASELRFVVAKPKPWQMAIFSAAGIDRQLLPLRDGLYRLRNVWVAPRGLTSIINFRTRCFDRVLTIQERLGLPASDPPKRRLFVSRASTTHRRILNEVEAQRRLMSDGFQIVRPETLSFIDQVRLFADAEIVIGAFGAGLTNAAFMKPGAALLEIAPPTSTIFTAHNAIFSTMSGLKQLRYGLVTGSDKSFNPVNHDFEVPIPWLDQLVSRFV